MLLLSVLSRVLSQNSEGTMFKNIDNVRMQEYEKIRHIM